MILILYFYANEALVSQKYPTIIESLSQIVLGIWIWKSFRPKTVKEKEDELMQEEKEYWLQH